MSRRQFYSTLFILIVICLSAIVNISAQETPAILNRLEVALWPEYDDPRLLVIYRGELADDPKGSLIFPISRGAQVHAVAHRGAEGQLLADDWQIIPGSDGQRLVAFAPRSRQFQLEYYEQLSIDEARKSFTFVFQSGRFDIKDVQLEFRQPLGALELKATPELEKQGIDDRGFVFFTRGVGAMHPEMQYEQTVSYLRANALPSIKPLNGGSDSAGWPWQIIGGLAALTISLAGLISIWWMRKKPRSQKISSKRRRDQTKSLPADYTDSNASHFCTQCGRHFKSEERFCPHCGLGRV